MDIHTLHIRDLPCFFAANCWDKARVTLWQEFVTDHPRHPEPFYNQHSCNLYERLFSAECRVTRFELNVPFGESAADNLRF